MQAFNYQSAGAADPAYDHYQGDANSQGQSLGAPLGQPSVIQFSKDHQKEVIKSIMHERK